MKMTNSTKISLSYIFIDGALIIVSLFMGGLWLINTQAAFISSLFIVFASFLSYKSMIQKRVKNGQFVEEDEEQLDKIDDKYGLFEDNTSPQNSDISKEEFKEIYQQERKKTNSVKKSAVNLMSSWSGALGLYRVFAYIILFVLVLVLIKNNLFEPIAFFVGLGVIPISSIFLTFMLRD